MSKIIVVAPHADDEVLGAGGYLLKHKELGDSTFWLLVTDMKEEYGYSKESCITRAMEIEKVKELFSFDKMYNMELKPGSLDSFSMDKLVEKIGLIFREVNPDIVILPNKTDIHSDHSIVFQAAYSCTKIFRYTSIKQIMCMEVISETDYAISDCGFIPNYFVNIENYIDKKVKLAEIYQSEIQATPFPRSKENLYALSVVRGGSSLCKNAEAFRLLKQIEP